MKTQAQLDAYKRWLERNRENARLRSAAWREKNKAAHRASIDQWAKEHPEQAAAAMAVRQAVYDGRLIKTPCEVCGDDRTEGHHASYAPDMWLNVVWLCKRHHREIHAKGAKVREATPYGKQWTDAEIAQAAEIRNTGARWAVVGSAFGVSASAVREALRSRNIAVLGFSRWGPR